MINQCAATHNDSSFIYGKEDLTAGIDNIFLWIAKHDDIGWLNIKIILNPCFIKPCEIIGIFWFI